MSRKSEAQINSRIRALEGEQEKLPRHRALQILELTSRIKELKWVLENGN